MGSRRGTVGAFVVAGSGIALLVIMFVLNWYEAEVPESTATPASGSLSFDAWEAFDFVEYGLLLVGVIGVAVGVVAATRSGDLVAVAGALAAVVGGVGFLVLAYRVVDPPTLIVDGIVIEEEGGVEIATEVGAFLGLLAVAGVMIGGWLCLRESGMSLQETVARVRAPHPRR